VWPQVIAGTYVQAGPYIGNGKKIMFWKDVWLEGFGQLLQHVAHESSVKESNVLMEDMVTVDNQWRQEELAHLLMAIASHHALVKKWRMILFLEQFGKWRIHNQVCSQSSRTPVFN
jgi:hypothetical protein